MMSTSSFLILKNILEENFPWTKLKEINVSDKLREDLELDSLSMVNLQVSLEDNLGIRFDPIEMDIFSIFNSVNSLVEFIDESKRTQPDA